MPRYQAILLDLFGTLIATEPAGLPVLQIGGTPVRTTLAGLGALLDVYAPGVGPDVFWHALAAVSEEMARRRAREHVEEPSRERFRRALARVGCGARACDEGGAALARAHHHALGAATVLPPDHTALLDALRRSYHLAVVSNFDDTASAYDILQRHGILGRVDAVVVSESLGRCKPHPLVVETALRLLGVPGDSALLVGDTFSEDVGAAHAAGIDAAWIDRDGRGVPPDAAPPRFVLRALPDLPAVLAADVDPRLRLGSELEASMQRSVDPADVVPRPAKPARHT
jgi:FMN phosphatase YigB (HAD superfamily)